MLGPGSNVLYWGPDPPWEGEILGEEWGGTVYGISDAAFSQITLRFLVLDYCIFQ